MKYKFLFLFVFLSIFLASASQTPTPYSFDLTPGTFFNNVTANVNSSNIWNTITLGPLDDANSTQMNSVGGTLTINDTFIASLGFQDPTTSIGDIIYRNFANNIDRLGVGSNGQVLTTVGGSALAWTTLGGAGGAESDIQFNTGGAFDGDSNFTFQTIEDILTLKGDFNMESDLKKIFFGAAADSSISYNGTGMIFDSQEVGTGDFFFLNGDINAVAGMIIIGDGTGTGQLDMNRNGIIGNAIFRMLNDGVIEWTFGVAAGQTRFQILEDGSPFSASLSLELGGDINVERGDLLIDTDNKGLVLGDGQDASIIYTGTDVQYQSRLVGSGDHVFLGGDVRIINKLEHQGDTNTMLRFDSDRVRLEAGGIRFIDMRETTDDFMTFNPDANDVDITFESVNVPNILVIDGGEDSVTFNASINITNNSITEILSLILSNNATIGGNVTCLILTSPNGGTTFEICDP